MPAEVGSRLPAFSLPDQSGKVHTAQSLLEHATTGLVIYFYPKDDTSSCTAEACGFRDELSGFESVGALVVGISPDGVKSHAKFASKYDLNFTLLADEPGSDGTPPTCAAFGVWGEKSMYGRSYMGVIRTTFLVDQTGVIRVRWDNVKVNGHVEEVRQAAAKLAGRDAGGDSASGDGTSPSKPAGTKPLKKGATKAQTKAAKQASEKKVAKKASATRASSGRASTKKATKKSAKSTGKARRKT
ncbi:MAG: peroxiredoxin [Planctomycetota bacterium]|nr:peroxiredoxin [Planctomycetota bacterium]